MVNGPHKQSGQALVYVTVMLGVMALGLAYVYNSYILSNEKTRLQNATDAVAYSVATVEARDLNFKAYTNRAMIANQIAVAQFVGLVSWIRWADNTARNINAIGQFIPYVNVVTGAIRNAMNAVRNVMEPIMQAAASAADLIIELLQNSQNVYHYGTIAVARDTMVQVAQANDPAIDTGLSFGNFIFAADYFNKHRNFTRQFDPDAVKNNASTVWGRRGRNYLQNRDRMEEFRSITMNSRDGFSSNRNYRFGPRITIPYFRKWEMRRSGGTELVGDTSQAQYYSWIAMDTMSLHQSKFKCRRLRCRWRGWSEIIPIGWGAARNGEDVTFARFNGRNNVGGSWRVNPWASRLASTEFQTDDEVESFREFGGLREFYDLRLNGLIQQGPDIKIMLTKAQNQTNTVGNLNYGAGKLDLESEGGMLRNRMAAMAQASPYFARINDNRRGSGNSRYVRTDGMREYGNLYNPYWQAKLTPVSDSAKRTIQALALVK
jgi:hypothetical protein